MEEASVAGESPDKSEQQKSSGTALSESDPRLAVFREPSADGAAAGNGSGSGSGKTDTATAVFRTDAVTDAVAGAGEGAEADAEAESDTATAVFRSMPSENGESRESRESGDENDENDENGDGAGVADGAAAGPDSEASAVSAVSAAEDSESADGAVDAEGTAEAAGAEKPADAPEEAPEASEGADAAEAQDAPETADAAEAAEEPGAEGGSDDEVKASGGAQEGDARLRAAVAAWVTKDGDEATKDDDDAKTATSEDEDEGEGDAEAPGADDVTPEAAKGSADADADAESKADDDADGLSGDDKASSDEEKKPDAEDDKDADAAEDKSGIDQPTAIFRAPAAPKVDQPTTALKILPSESKSESAAERTSKFVPLRGDEARPAPTPPPRKPQTPAAPAAPAPASLSTAERTTQQPMPPKPPLDLLAELTNTPPPPETPVRTAVRRVKIWTPLVLLLLIVFAVAQAVRPLPTPTLALSANPTYTFGGGKLEMPWPGEGQGAVEVEGVGSLGTYGNQKAAPIASVAKIMTAYVILKDHPITGKQNGGLIEVDKKAGEEANRPDESTAPIQEGQKYTQRQMLQLLMIPSGNNVARLLARWDAKTEEAFVERMNAAAKDLGMTNSTYTDPSGLESTTRSTPADQLKLAKAVMQNDIFREIVNMPQADIPGIGKTIYNNNVILLEPGVSGIKTGSSTPAGGNLVWAADTVIDGKSRRIVGAVMGAQLDGTLDAKLQRAIQNSLKLIKAAQKGVVSAPVVKKGDVVGYVDNGVGGRTPVVSTKDLKAIGWGGLTVSLKIGAGDKPIPHSAKAGTTVGEVTVGTGTGKVSAPVTLQSEMTEPTFGDKLTRIG
ncbi:D-alanyl-D-alanine carboxypeptidase [Streptomyces sp. NBC_00893]|uniref:D-alanyl-D-alanine carboxypeptidase n=1 Tax=Streptomyces sp. NBC_00893 TaxID=2975862 RepID=UPI002253C80A|nr:D-alanyl-D-alanine carboxypeptidase [Streptomyces sp. NBC_00893]MCX4847354.1 D-alanyl-D-alanine carboxypeptidase [Streptomyces sp. NBC_00893]